jgi:hypothetical protein
MSVKCHLLLTAMPLLLLLPQAFSAVGAMQGAWYLATGEALSLSEQQIVDCSWDYEVSGCNGGEMEPAIQYIADHGGAMQEADYQYLGVNGFCRWGHSACAALHCCGWLCVPAVCVSITSGMPGASLPDGVSSCQWLRQL